MQATPAPDAAQGVLLPVLHGDVSPESMDAATGQHFALAGLCLVVGLAELLRAEARLRQWLMPVFLAGVDLLLYTEPGG